MEMTELLPTHLDPPVKFQPVTLESLESAESVSSFTLGNFSENDNFAWVTKGSCIEVVNRRTANRCGSWSFGAIVKEPNTMITCVSEFSISYEPLLLVGLHCRGIGMLCIYNPVKSKLVSAIELPSKVVSLEVIDNSKSGEVLISYLQSFSGMVAVGMDGGLVYLLDLCLDQQNLSDETQPAKVNAIPASTPQIYSYRDSLDTLEHLAIILDKESCSRGSYFYRRPDGKTIQSFNGGDVCITSMKFIPQIGALIVGVNFGCFQVWKMDRLMLEYSSPYEADLAPITHFVYQEPENDPKNFVYIWIGRGPTFVDRRDGDCSALSLYQLSYDNKKTLNNQQVFYSSLSSVMHKFEHPLTADPYNVNGLNVYGSTLISCEVLTDAAHQHIARREDGIDDHHVDLSLCAFLWDASTDADSKPVYLLGLFDLNRWYHAQMPHSVRPAYLCHGVCPFFAFCNLEDIVETTGPQNILSAQIARESVTRYRSTVIPAPEQHFYPSALAFDLHCLLESSLMTIHFSGVQKQILYDLRRNNPAPLIEPTDTFNRCTLAEILPKFCDPNADLSISDQRDALLSVCVENAMTDVILSCINSWVDGEYSRSGCTLRVILSAAWSRVVKTKETIDKTCVPLFDCSVTGVDKQTISLLHQQESELGRLCRVFQQLLNLAGTTTEQGAHDLQVKLNVTSLLHEYMQVLTWLVVVGLLPETMEGDHATNKYNYPSESLAQAFSHRRQELISLHQDMAFTDLLMIDGMLDNIGGQVKDLWNKEGGNGLYPPPSLNSVLAIYLLNEVPLYAKHSILFYLLLDLISFASDQDQTLVQECSLFAQCFGMSPSMARIVQGFWLLDHRDFTEALHVLLDPVISKQDLSGWQHTRIVRALLYQGEARSALMYMNTRLPNPVTPDDVKLKLTVLLASGNINQAFEYQRRKRDPGNCLDLIQHFFTGCMQTRNLGHLVQLPLDDFEDKQLAEFLRNTSTCESMELLVMYYLQRCRYVEAIRLNDQLQKLRVVDTNPDVVQRSIARDAIIQAHVRNLPEVQRDLVRAKKPDDVPIRRERIEVLRPKPLSTKVNNNPVNRINSRATLICAVMEKVKEVESTEPEERDDEPLEVFVSLPATPKPKHALNESIIQAPSTMEKDLSHFLKRTPPPGRSPLSKISESAKKRMQKYQNAEAMSLLATPPVKRVTRSRVKACATPQSILKVRNTVRNQSPLVKSARTVDEKDPTARRNPFVTMSGSPHALKPGTPKLLRFVLSPSRSATQLAKPLTDFPTAPKDKPAEDHEDTVMSQVVDEDITFNFNVSHLKANAEDNQMDTDNQSCPSTPRDLDDTTGTPSPDKKEPSISFSDKLKMLETNTPREQISQFVDEEMEAEDVVVTERKKPTSPYQPAKDLLAAFRREYEAAHPDEPHVGFKESEEESQESESQEAESQEECESQEAESQEESQEEETQEEESQEEESQEEDFQEEESQEEEEEEVEMTTEMSTAIKETQKSVSDTPREVTRLIRASPEPSPLRDEPPPSRIRQPVPVTRFATQPKVPDVSQIVKEASKTAKQASPIVTTEKKEQTPVSMATETATTERTTRSAIAAMEAPSSIPVRRTTPSSVATKFAASRPIQAESATSHSEKEVVGLMSSQRQPGARGVMSHRVEPERQSTPTAVKPNKSETPVTSESTMTSQARMSPPSVSPEAEAPCPPDIVEVIEIESSQSDAAPDSPPVLEQMVDLDSPPRHPALSSPEDQTRDAKTQSPRRSPRIAKKLTKEDTSLDRRERQSSPLSSDAFMMKLRHSHRGSREHTPEAASEEIKFTFSDPVALDAQTVGGTTPAPKPFIFSPPVTRSRGKRRDPDSVRAMRSSLLDPTGSISQPPPSASGLLDVSLSDSVLLDQSSVFETSQTTKSTTKKTTRRKIAMESTSDSPINFVSPVAATSSQSDGDITKSGKPEPKRSLRPRFRVVRPERKSVRLMKK